MTAYCLLNHALTAAQEKELAAVWGCSSVVYPPQGVAAFRGTTMWRGGECCGDMMMGGGGALYGDGSSLVLYMAAWLFFPICPRTYIHQLSSLLRPGYIMLPIGGCSQAIYSAPATAVCSRPYAPP